MADVRNRTFIFVRSSWQVLFANVQSASSEYCSCVANRDGSRMEVFWIAGMLSKKIKNKSWFFFFFCGDSWPAFRGLRGPSHWTLQAVGVRGNERRGNAPRPGTFKLFYAFPRLVRHDTYKRSRPVIARKTPSDVYVFTTHCNYNVWPISGRKTLRIDGRMLCYPVDWHPNGHEHFIDKYGGREGGR